VAGFFKAIRNAVLPGDSAAQPTGWLARFLSRTRTAAGVEIHEGNALGVADWNKGCRVISETGAMLPLKIYKHLDPRGRSEARNHPLFFLLHDEPNDRMTSFTWRICMFLHLLNWGRHASYIERDGAGRVLALWPIRPDMFRWELRDGKMWFFVTTMTGQQVQFWADEILYIPGMSVDGINTMSPVQMLRESLGLSKAMETYAASFFGNGSNAGGYLTKPEGNLSEEAASRLKKQWEERHTGLDNAHRPAVLEEGMTFVASTVPNDAAQFLQSRAFQRSEIAGALRVPPHKIGDLSRSTNNNIEAQEIEFLTDCMAPWFERIEQAMNKCLLLPREKGRYYIEFDVKGFMRGDSTARSNYYNKRFLMASISPNEIREAENENPIEGGDVYYVGSGIMRADAVPAVAAATADAGDVNDGNDVTTQ
jgi:HK97 family phage portal protein